MGLTRAPWSEVDPDRATCLGGEVGAGVGAWLLKARPLPPSGPGPFPSPTQRKTARHPELVASLDRGTSINGTSVSGPRSPGLGPRTLSAPQYDPRLAGIGTAPVLTEELRRRRADWAAHRHAAAGRSRWGSLRWGDGGQERVTSSWTVSSASRLHLGLPLCAARRREGLRSKIGTLKLFFSTTWP